MRPSRAPLPLSAPWEEATVQAARALGVSLEIWSPASHHGQRLALGPVCERCEHQEPRAFDRCRKRRAYLTRPEVDLPDPLTEKCPQRVRLSRRGSPHDAAGPLVFAFGHGIDDAVGETDAAMLTFLDAIHALVLPPAAPLAAAAPALDRLEAETFLDLVRRGNRLEDPCHAVATAASAAPELLATVVAALESRRPSQRGHARRVQLIAQVLGRELEFDAPTRDGLHWAALLHAVGGLGFPGPDDGEACALDAAGGPAASERLESTRRLLETLPGFETAGAILRRHREPTQVDAATPPALAVPVGRAAGCLAVADALDILMGQRGPRRPRTLFTAIAALTRSGSARFDSQVLQALERAAPRLQRHAWIFLLYRHV